MNESDSTLQIECKIAGRAADMIFDACENDSIPLGEYHSLGQETISTLEVHYKNKYLANIVSTIQRALSELVPDSQVIVEAASLKRMVLAVHVSLELHPYTDRDENGNPVLDSEGNVVQYESFFLPENFGQEGFLYLPHDNNDSHQNNLSDTFRETLCSHAREALGCLCGERFDLIETYHKIISQNYPNTDPSVAGDIIREIEKCSAEISSERKEIYNLRPKNSTELLQSGGDGNYNYEYSGEDLRIMFEPSPAENCLMRFLPKGLQAGESYLFDFDSTFDAIFGTTFNDPKQHYKRVIYERKLLIYYYASISDYSLIGSINRAISQLDSEIQACQKIVSQVLDTEGEESERESIISRVRLLYLQAESLRENCCATELGHEVVAIFGNILRYLSLFLVQPNAAEPYTQEDLANNPADIQKVLHRALQTSLHGLGAYGNISPITDMRRILHEVINLLAHK